MIAHGTSETPKRRWRFPLANNTLGKRSQKQDQSSHETETSNKQCMSEFEGMWQLILDLA